jgi:outer membrane protein TolC
LPLPSRLSADLLGSRADILAARARIEGAGAERHAARAAFYPDVNLAAFIGPQALGLSSFTSGSALALGVGPALHLPIFEGGRLSAAYRAATAAEDIAIAAYNAAVVQAVREATDALSAVETAKADAARQREVLGSLTASGALTAERVRAGLAARQEQVNADEALLTARQAMADIAADGAIRRIRLAVALGGGFTPPPSASTGTPPLPSAQRP